MKEKFENKNFTAKSLDDIQKSNAIISEYAAMGYDLSLRQLFYQHVARGYRENSERSYKTLGNLISDARLAGMIDWNMIRDRNRVQIANSHWETPADILETAANSFRIDKWNTQPSFVMVMVEKQALEGVLIPVCRELDIPFIANKGYSSSSTMYEIGKRVGLLNRLSDKEIHILYLGDHDPSGIDMTRDVEDRLCLFSRTNVNVKRLALNYDQVQEYQPPENPTKISDSRANSYIANFGYSSWELDALPPDMLGELVRNSVESLMDMEIWEEAVEKENKMIRDLKSMAENYTFDSDNGDSTT